MHPPSPVQGLRQKAAIGAVEMMEETMRVLTINELMRLTRIELCDLLAKITAALPTFREGSPQRTTAYINLRNIRAVLARRDFSPEARAAPALAGADATIGRDLCRYRRSGFPAGGELLQAVPGNPF
jgi:hypothetical protein